jgi:hypothetical protein
MLESRGGVAGQPVPEGGVAGNPRGLGKIINVSSLVAFQGECGFTAFCRTAPFPSLRPLHKSSARLQSLKPSSRFTDLHVPREPLVQHVDFHADAR